MRPTFIKLIIVISIFLSSALSGFGQSVFGQEGPRYRILIDASKDGGSWWFPQAGIFDDAVQHQGKPFADMLRREGAEVVEIGRGEAITKDKLSGFDLIIRVRPFFSYSPSEALAYKQSVAEGTRLLIIGGATHNRDIVAEAFGLYFESRTHFTSLNRWVRHPFTQNFDEAEDGVWSGMIKAPNRTVILGWINGSEEISASGFLPYGRGYVVFTGQALSLRSAGDSAGKDLIDSIKKLSLDDVLQIPATEQVVAKAPLREGPTLIEPQPDSYLPQPGKGEWRFDWEDIPDAVNYEIVILGRSASVPLARVAVNKSEIVMGRRDADRADDEQNSAYIADHNLLGWSWRVRAQLRDGSWGAWSSERRFNIRGRSAGRL